MEADPAAARGVPVDPAGDLESRFLKGVAISTWQNSGDEASNWTAFSQRTTCCGLGSTVEDGNAGRFSNFWDRYEEDIENTKKLGCNCFRFSFEWARLEPSKGSIDQSAIERYHAILDCLDRHGLEPVATLHHFVHPQWFEEMGSFCHEENVAHFVAYSSLVFKEFSRRVVSWATFNEPSVSMFSGYLAGLYPPGRMFAFTTAGRYLKNVLVAHVNAYKTMKALPGGNRARVGLVVHDITFVPRRRWYMHSRWISNWMTYWWGRDVVLDFMMTGQYEWRAPGRGVRVKHSSPGGRPPCDWLGINYYTRCVIGWRLNATHMPGEVMTDMPYPVYPRGLYNAIKKLSALGIPMYITETGIADLRDDRRKEWIRGYTRQIVEAIKDGFDVRGFMYWTLVDNLEWNFGYKYRFGLYRWDPEKGGADRQMRESAKFLRYVYQTWPSDLQKMREYAKRMSSFEEGEPEGRARKGKRWWALA